MGEHSVIIACSSEREIRWLERNFPNLTGTPSEPDIYIELHGGYGVPFVNYDVSVDIDREQVRFKRADYSIEATDDFRKSKLLVHDELAFKHALMNLYSSYIVEHQWGLLVHSSCAVESGLAHLFAGYSGAGKSTAAKLSHPRLLLSDEATIIRVSPKGGHVYNSPFRSELDTEDPLAMSPLGGIHLLKQAAYNQRTQLDKISGLMMLMDKVFFWPGQPRDAAKVLELLRCLVQRVPIYELSFQNSNSFWELIMP